MWWNGSIKLPTDIKMDDLDELKKQAAPQTKRMADGIDELLKATKANGEKLDTINGYKERQANGDIKFRKQSSLVSGISVSISLLALYISISANGIGSIHIGVEQLISILKDYLW